MRFGNLETKNGPAVVAVELLDDKIKFLNLNAADSSLPETLQEVLALENGLARARDAYISALENQQWVNGQLLAPIARPGKVICIGLNYRDHAEETGAEIPSEPVCFCKFSSSVIGPEQPIRLPQVATKVDYEAELVVVIGKAGKNIAESDALEYVAGYANGHDVSARDWQIGRPGGQWLLGKTPDTFAPIGPWLVTADEVPNPHQLSIELRLNGEVMQQSTTAEFIFTVQQLIAHLSQLVTLEPGDVIFTGTPPGVGMARDPQVFLQPGDVVEVEVAGLGVLRNPVVAE